MPSNPMSKKETIVFYMNKDFGDSNNAIEVERRRNFRKTKPDQSANKEKEEIDKSPASEVFPIANRRRNFISQFQSDHILQFWRPPAASNRRRFFARKFFKKSPAKKWKKTIEIKPAITNSGNGNWGKNRNSNGDEGCRPRYYKRQKHYESDDWGCGNWCEYMIIITLASVLLVGALTLVLFWVLYYRGGFGWQENPKKQFNLHPVLMVAGYIFFSGFSILLYRICRCCRKIYVKLFHALFHALAIPCIVIGFLAVWDFHNSVQPPIPNFYSLHSWLGLVTSGLFALQFVVGFFSFLILLCCEGATAAFRASLVPIHSSFGIITFMLAVATCLTGLTQKALFTFGPEFTRLVPEVVVVNTLAVVLAASAIVIGYSVMREDLKCRDHHLISMNSDFETYQNWLEEGIIMNAMGMVFVGLGILLSYVVRRDSLRYKSDYFDTERL